MQNVQNLTFNFVSQKREQPGRQFDFSSLDGIADWRKPGVIFSQSSSSGFWSYLCKILLATTMYDLLHVYDVWCWYARRSWELGLAMEGGGGRPAPTPASHLSRPPCQTCTTSPFNFCALSNFKVGVKELAHIYILKSWLRKGWLDY